MDDEQKSERIGEIGKQTSMPPSNVYASDIPERKFFLNKTADFLLGFLAAFVISICCLSSAGIALLFVPALRKTDEFQKYKELTNGLMIGLAIFLSVMAVAWIVIAISYMHDKHYR